MGRLVVAARQVVETNIVRGREAYGGERRTWRRERRRQTSALESMRMSEGSERRRMAEGGRERRSGSEREGENKGRGRRSVRGRGRREREGRMASIRWKERGVEVQENRLLAEGAEGSTRGQDTRRMRGGRGNARSRSDSVPSFSFVPFAQPFSAFFPSCFLPRVPPLLLSSFHARIAPALSLSGPNSSLPLSLFLSPRVPLLASGRGSPITAERARSKAPRAWSYSFRGAQYLGDRRCK